MLTLRAPQENQRGFTIVELLIVIVIIAILAAISIVAYRGIQNRANDTTVEADIANVIKKMEYAKADLGHYPRSFADFPDGFKFSKGAYAIGTNHVNYIIDIQNDRYALGIQSKSGMRYVINTGTITKGASLTTSAVALADQQLGLAWGNALGVSFATQGYIHPNWNST